MLKRKTPLKTTKQWRPRKSKAARNREFSPAVRKAIYERCEGICELCGSARVAHIHHCQYRSALGGGEISNGLGLCNRCHSLAHKKREVRERCVIVAQRLAGGEEIENHIPKGALHFVD